MPDDLDLPGVLDEIAEIVGREAALTISEHYGGVRVSIPAKLHAEHWLVKLIGARKAQDLAEYFTVGSPEDRHRTGIRDLIVPSLDFGAFFRVGIEIRRLALRDFQSGESVRNIARKHRIHERTVWRWRAQWKAEGLL